MGRTKPSQGLPPPSFRRDARAKNARATLNNVIPALLSAHPRARRGVEAAELIKDPTALDAQVQPSQPEPHIGNGKGKNAGSKRKERRTSSGSRSTTTSVTSGSSPPSLSPSASSPSPPNSRPAPAHPHPSGGPRLTLRVADTLTAAHTLLSASPGSPPDLSNRRARIAILNMASPLTPGGGFVNGASSQEESLCMRTTLLPSLRDDFYRLPETGAVWTPDVLVFRDNTNKDLDKRDRWFVNCVSAGMLRMPDVLVEPKTGRGRYASDKDRELVGRKCAAVMQIFKAKGARRVVLGAWGCGAYGNPVGEVAAAWRKVLLGRTAKNSNRAKGKGEGFPSPWEGIEEVVFAIKDRGLADGFASAFGNGLIREEEQESEAEEEAGDDEENAARVREIQQKIRELKVRLGQTTSEQVRTVLAKVLVDLKGQLEFGGEVDSDEEEGVAEESASDGEETEDENGEGESDDEAASGEDSE